MCLASQEKTGSGLVIVLAVLAMLAIMATTFISLMRLDIRITANYVDDQRCELLARGMLTYFQAVLREDSDRTFAKYVNRQTNVGAYRWFESGVNTWIPGLGEEAWGTTASRSFWFYGPSASWGDWTQLFGDRNDYSSWLVSQGTFASNNMIIGRYQTAARRAAGLPEVDAWIDRAVNARDAGGKTVSLNHPDAVQAIDDDSDGTPSPTDTVWGPLYNSENGSDWRYYYDAAPFIISAAGGSKYFAGQKLTGEATLPGGLYWRWGAKVGVPTSTYLDLNVAGNLDGADGQYLGNMGGINLQARRCLDETSDRAPYNGTNCTGLAPYGSDHLGRIEWNGFAGDVCHDTNQYNVNPATGVRYAANGFPVNYDAVFWHPSQLGMEKTFFQTWIPTETPLSRNNGALPNSKPASSAASVLVGRDSARALIRYRWGSDGRPADGSDRWRVGWRRDGATYYKLPTPENPQGNDRYFGVNEVIEHDRSVYHPATSAVSAVLQQADPANGKWDERAIRPYFTTWSTDTILRGKIWPTEGPLPWRNAQPGDWKHIDILKRVNINIIGASNPDDASYPHLPNEDLPLLRKWYSKRGHERDRLYYMLKAAMKFTSTPSPETKACQFIASLADMVDRDQQETFYAAPDGTGAWGLGVEKSPVINEVVFYLSGGASGAGWDPTTRGTLRLSLYNPMENIPWIPDADEAYDISNYVVKIVGVSSGAHVYRLGDLRRYGRSDQSDRPVNQDMGPVTTIGADGMWGDPNDATKKSWSRFLHVGWLTSGNASWPAGLTKADISGPITVQLWKPLYGDAQSNAPVNGSCVDTVMGGIQKYLRVDDTGSLQLIDPARVNAPGGYMPNVMGIYRRFDPMNAKCYGTPVFDSNGAAINASSTIHWTAGNNLTAATLGMPNVWAGSNFGYKRFYERNFKVVDGDLPSIGWLGEVVTWNVATNGPLTQLHSSAQDPNVQLGWGVSRPQIANQLDLKAKFDLFRPFMPITPTPHYDPAGSEVNPCNLHVLDIFTVWDPSNDGIDNDGDGAVDDDDTGLQPGDKSGPEVRVFGKLDINHMPRRAWWAFLPNNEFTYDVINQYPPYGRWNDISLTTLQGREGPRGFTGSNSGGDYCTQGPYETIGDCLRADSITGIPGRMWAMYDGSVGPGGLGEVGSSSMFMGRSYGDDDGDGICDERDERDQLFTWAANILTTRANVFQIDLNVELCAPPYYPGRKLPFPAYRVNRSFARKQLLGTLDRSTTLRVFPDGSCDFSGPVQVKLLRFSDDLRID